MQKHVTLMCSYKSFFRLALTRKLCALFSLLSSVLALPLAALSQGYMRLFFKPYLFLIQEPTRGQKTGLGHVTNDAFWYPFVFYADSIKKRLLCLSFLVAMNPLICMKGFLLWCQAHLLIRHVSHSIYSSLAGWFQVCPPYPPSSNTWSLGRVQAPIGVDIHLLQPYSARCPLSPAGALTCLLPYHKLLDRRLKAMYSVSSGILTLKLHFTFGQYSRPQKAIKKSRNLVTAGYGFFSTSFSHQRKVGISKSVRRAVTSSLPRDITGYVL